MKISLKGRTNGPEARRENKNSRRRTQVELVRKNNFKEAFVGFQMAKLENLSGLGSPQKYEINLNYKGDDEKEISRGGFSRVVDGGLSHPDHHREVLHPDHQPLSLPRGKTISTQDPR